MLELYKKMSIKWVSWEDSIVNFQIISFEYAFSILDEYDICILHFHISF